MDAAGALQAFGRILHVHNSWLFLPACSALVLVLLLAVRGRGTGGDLVRIVGLSLGIVPFLVFLAKDMTSILRRATLGTEWALKYGLLVLGLPTTILFVVSTLAMIVHATTRVPGATDDRRRAAGLFVVLAILQVAQSLWLFEADAPL